MRTSILGLASLAFVSVVAQGGVAGDGRGGIAGGKYRGRGSKAENWQRDEGQGGEWQGGGGGRGGDWDGGGGGGGWRPGPGPQSPLCQGLPGTPQCCQLNALGVIGATCNPPGYLPRDVQEFQEICAQGGSRAECCVLPGVAGQGVLCNPPKP